MNSRTSISADIRRKLTALRAARLGVEIRSQSLLFFALSITLGMVFLLLEVLLELGSSARTAMTLLYLTGLALFAAWFVIRPVLQRLGILDPPSDLQLAGSVGEFFPAIRDRLLNLLQLHEEASAGSYYSPELIDASFQDFAPDLQNSDFLQSVDRSPVRRSGKIFFLSSMIVAVPALFTPSSVGDALYRLVHFSQEFVPESRVTFEVLPGNKEIVKGESVPVLIRTLVANRHSEGPLRLRWRPEGQVKFEEEQLHTDSSGVFRTTLAALRLSTEYYAEYMNEESGRFLLTVVDRPIIRSLRVRLDYPAYTRLPSQIQDEFIGDVTALVGTRLTVSGTASKLLRSGRIAFKNDSSRPLDIRGQQFSVRFPLREDTPYRINVADAQDLANADPVTYQIKTVSDESPQISILRPERVIDIAGVTSVPLLAQVKDDFGFSSLRLGYRLAQSRYEAISDQFRFLAVPLPEAPRVSEDVSYLWDVAPLHLAPEDVVEYFLEVFDNDAVSGPKSARTFLYRLRLPSLQEVFADLDKGHEEALDQITESAEAAKELKEKIESLNKDLKKNKDPDWQQQKNMEETAKRYQELQEKMDEVQKKLESMVDQMSQQNVLSPETMEKYRELQDMLKEIDSAELQNALKQLQQAMQSQSREKLQQALEQVTFSEERFRESIERTMNLLKRIQIEQKLDELKKRAEELASEQQELAKETADEKANPEDLAQKQEDLKEKLKKMQESSDDVQNRMEEFFTEMPEQELENANSQLAEKQVEQKMTQSAQQMRSGQRDRSQKLQEQIQGDLQNFSQSISQLQSEMLQQQQQYIMNALKRATNNMLELSKKQESLKEESKTAPPNSPQLRQNAQEQLSVMNDLANVIEGLNQVAQRSFATTPEMAKAIGEAVARMQSAMRYLDIRSGQMASQEQGKAMAALNRAAMEIQDALKSMMAQSGGGAGGGLLGQLQSMAGRQMSINMRTQGAEDAARLAVEQEALRKSVEQLNREAKAGTEKERILGDLDRIAAEMKEVVRNLEQKDVNPETIQRQERILSRLLDAARSTRERDFENRRKAETGTQVARRSPGELDPLTLEGRNRLRDDLLKAIEQGYSKDYQELIRKYFEQLQKVDN